MSNLIKVELNEDAAKTLKSLEDKISILLRAKDNETTLDGDRLLRIEDVEDMVKFTRKWIYANIQKGDFPKPTKQGNASRWKLSDIQKWISEQEYMQ
ncbi:AlpA family phage regulatory protein [Ignatzschineria rhizosphaerae]|uniref:AlpA family phage regulatory protein n=1 Tax=Ignatzschineria rhizosphaerae TaxID=2923279 RepID=A0ABY3X7B5_9GAMM|nr:AlpA family phage regulatory protein [Ignatzschineria rhizosphaerae]UNM95898.1 AlpA family phage regulatory protein [Ignatzschineria rhizosphaerae]